MHPPIAKKIPKTLEQHGHRRTDPYYWLNERENPEVIAYLEAENAYKKAQLAHTQALQDQLFEELKGRIKQDDSSVPYPREGFLYYTRYETGKEYPIYCRRPAESEPEEVILDVNSLAEGHDYCSVAGGDNASHDHRYLAYAIDTVGRRIYTLKVKDLQSGQLLPVEIPGITGNVVWARDNRTLFYSKRDPQTLRSFQIYRHVLGSDPAADELVYEEKDETFRCYITLSKSRDFLIIMSESTLTHEALVLEADQPQGSFRVFAPRERGHEYNIDHADGQFYILSNWQAKNFRLMRCGEQATSREAWEDVIPPREHVLIENFELFKDYLVVDERRGGLNHLQVLPKAGEAFYVPMPEAAYSINLGHNYEYDTPWLRFHYESMTTPPSVYDFQLQTGETLLKKEQEVLGGFDKNLYQAERIFATAPDGVHVPISLVYHKDTSLNGKAPLLLYGYGSYGYSLDPYFSPNRLSLLNRGFVFAIAHIRGGEEMGRSWYEEGRQLKKKNTFTDFIACGEHLIAEGYAAPDKLFAMGGSAGGLLMGAVMNMRPDLWAGVVSAVPFVDVVTTMLDDSIPLTTGEYDEWGNPNEKEFYDYILSYSPYDQVTAQAYPPTLVTTGLHDSQVQYWEPAKWVAKLRELKTDDNPLLLHTNMDAGHGGKSGRFAALKEVAMEYAFLLDLAGKEE
jgi:oligopeptidase B